MLYSSYYYRIHAYSEIFVLHRKVIKYQGWVATAIERCIKKIWSQISLENKLFRMSKIEKAMY